MMLLVPLVVALASAPSPTPSAPAPTPLKEIGRTRALPACTTIVVHANGAITSALDNDRTLAIMVNNLKATDFDVLNPLQRRNAVEALMKQAEAIRVAGSSGDAEIKRLREMAAASNDAQRKAELKTFADALGGAIYRQKKAAVEFMRDVTIIRGREDAEEARDLMARDAPFNGAGPGFPTPRAAVPAAPHKYNDAMRQIALDLTDRQTGILVDEGIAADHSIPATSGC
ncbi:MAG: hypothetical protein JOZ24_10365 [Candidatus Eremiobacteraeota bacterium]|nr:hypothetical protein [Candidatus Eremiobacteraeota bacterium]